VRRGTESDTSLGGPLAIRRRSSASPWRPLPRQSARLRRLPPDEGGERPLL